MGAHESKKNLSRWIKTSVLLLIVFSIGIALGLCFSTQIPQIFKPAAAKEPIIGIISIYGYMITDAERDLYVNSILYAYRNESVAGIVLRVDSPGGYASIVEDIYNALRLLDAKKPVIAIVEGIAASGGYYVCLGAREIYSLPTAFIGNIGVIMRQPYLVIPSEDVIETGPYKYTGLSLKETPFIVKRALDNFMGAVVEGRGDRLNATLGELSLGKLYLGDDATKLGLIDGYGSLLDVINRVSSLANVTKYRTVDLTALLRANVSSLLGRTLWGEGKLISIELMGKLQPEPLGVYYISPYYVKAYGFIGEELGYMSSRVFTSSLQANFSFVEGNFALVDVSHGNLFTYEILGTLWGKLVSNGLKILFADIISLGEMMAQQIPKALIVICPSTSYDSYEISIVRNYVDLGGKLILIYDPSMVSSMFINSLAQEFGIYFSDGYLYDLKNNYGVYRNIVLRRFAEHSLVSNVNELTLFTAAHIYGGKLKIATTSNDSYLSLTEMAGSYSPIVAADNVIAIGDLTFLLDPFHDISDNDMFLDNLVKFIKA